jgi:hypothetical protein
MRRFGKPEASIAALFGERQENGGKSAPAKPMVYSGLYLGALCSLGGNKPLILRGAVSLRIGSPRYPAIRASFSM